MGEGRLQHGESPKWGVIREVEVPDNPVCPFCGWPISREMAMEMETNRIYQRRIEGPYCMRWDNPFIGWWKTKPWHCVEQAIAHDDADKRSRVGDHREFRPPLRPGRQPSAEISRIAKERGVSRDT